MIEVIMNLKKTLFVRRIVGASMQPALEPGQQILATSLLSRIHPGQIVIISHDGKEKVKRVERVNDDMRQVFVIGDNLASSTDSRHFGWLSYDNVIAKVILPNKNLHKE